MNDIYIDAKTHDIVIENNDLVIITDADRVRQQIDIKLKLWQGEWFLDTEFGTPYLSQILGKRISLNGAVAAIKQAILECADVIEITALKYNFIRVERRLAVEFECRTNYGAIRVKA